jgi:acyl transferase domain-containing protein
MYVRHGWGSGGRHQLASESDQRAWCLVSQVVYSRSLEQQKLAGSGRMLAVAVSEEEVQRLLNQYGCPSLEIACVNSPSSTVIAGQEKDVLGFRETLASDVSSALIPGNIAFHSSRTEPILASLRQRLAFLGDRPQAWNVPMVSCYKPTAASC